MTMNFRMGPMEYTRLWYEDKIEIFVRTAQDLIEEGITEDLPLAHELHEWLSATDSFLNLVSSDDEVNEMALSVLAVSPNVKIAGDYKEADADDYPYYAAHAFIADVMEKIGRPAGPYTDPV